MPHITLTKNPTHIDDRNHPLLLYATTMSLATLPSESLYFRPPFPLTPVTIEPKEESLPELMAIEYFMKLLHDLDVICSYPLEPSLESVLHFVVEFQKSLPELVARAHLQRLLVEDGKLYGRDPVFGVITRVAAVPNSIRNHVMQKDESIVHLGQLVINLLKILCTNSAWQRRKLGKILQDWRVVFTYRSAELEHGEDGE